MWFKTGKCVVALAAIFTTQKMSCLFLLPSLSLRITLNSSAKKITLLTLMFFRVYHCRIRQ